MKFKIRILETSEAIVDVEAKDLAQAFDKVNNMDIDLDYNGREFYEVRSDK